MGDPRKARKKYSRPLKPWVKKRIEEEVKLMKEFGLKRKKEIWIAAALLKKYREIAKEIIRLKSAHDPMAETLEKDLFKVLKKYGLIKEDAHIEDVLNLTVRDILNRRLQTLVYKKGLAKTPKQARQLIVHKHIMVNNKVVAAPSYLVKVEEENSIRFHPNSEYLLSYTQKTTLKSDGNETNKV
ncbi:MAG TPA: 30S ribosomal protein S4 [Nautiliaceae bacterium]|nr:30S ribosomal protein S4 [Nautiliaceae bacterium]